MRDSGTCTGRQRSGTIALLGAQIAALRLDEAVEAIAELVEDGGHHLVVTPNVDHLVQLTVDAELAAAYRHASLVLADGVPVVWASRLLGRPLPERVCGTDLLVPLCRRAEERSWRVFVLGGSPAVVDLARRSLTAQFPRLELAGFHAPPAAFERRPEEVARAVDAIREARPALVLLGLGTPKQEVFAWRHRRELGSVVALGVGSGIAYLCGWKRRAPGWMRRAGLEWLFRLLSEPRRLGNRYLVRDMRFVPLVLSAWARERRARLRP